MKLLHLRAQTDHSDVQGCPELVVSSVEFSATSDQKLNVFELFVNYGKVKGCRTQICFDIWVKLEASLAVERRGKNQNGKVARVILRCEVQHCNVLFRFCVEVAAEFLQDDIDHLCVSETHDLVNRRDTQKFMLHQVFLLFFAQCDGQELQDILLELI